MSAVAQKQTCRFCNAELSHSFCNLDLSPLSNAYLSEEKVHGNSESFYPLHAYVCDQCYLVQLEQFESPDKIFSDYAYFSSYSTSWLEHAKNYTSFMVEKYHLDTGKCHVVELASNDGYLLQYFQEKGFKVLGIEPAENVAEAARKKDIETLSRFFGVKTAEDLTAQGVFADLLIGNNVLAHVPDLNDFVQGMKILLSKSGIITMEFPHLLRLMKENQFDTIYHEHFSYFSLITVEKVFAHHGLCIFDVDEIPTHGGSLRIYARHKENSSLPISDKVGSLKETERAYGLGSLASYLSFDKKVQKVKSDLVAMLSEIKAQGKTIVGYGAPAKGNTLLNYCSEVSRCIDYTVDKSPHKQGLFLPGTHIPIKSPDEIAQTKPDYILILPWNLKDEILKQLSYTKDWGAQFIIPIPTPHVVS